MSQVLLQGCCVCVLLMRLGARVLPLVLWKGAFKYCFSSAGCIMRTPPFQITILMRFEKRVKKLQPPPGVIHLRT